MKKLTKHYIFRLVSSRGTDITTCVKLPGNLTKAQVKDISEEWSDMHVRDSAIESYTVYYKEAKIPVKSILSKRWDEVWKRKMAIDKKKAELQSMFNPLDWTKRY